MSVAAFRQLASVQNPFLLGSYPDRPSPTHVLNGFVAAALGVSSKAAALRKLIASDEPPPEDFASLTATDWAANASTLAAFRSDLSLIFNPNRRMWAEIGSPVPVHALFATSDPSDERYGPLMWELVSARADGDQIAGLSSLLAPTSAKDPVTTTALILVKEAQAGAPRRVGLSGEEWFGPRATPAGALLADRLAELVLAVARPVDDAQRLTQIQHLGRAVYLATILANLLGPIAAACTEEVESVDGIAPMVAWAGMPPGQQDHPVVMASARSLQTIIEAHRSSAAATLRDALSAVPLASGLPAPQRRRSAVREQYAASGVAPGRIDATISALATKAEVEIDGRDPAQERWIQDVLAGAYPVEHVTRGFRSMGWKLGFIGPDRGTGTPRFVCETPLLATLVQALCPPDGLDFELFVDEARTRLGIVFGLGTDDSLGERLGLWEGAGVARRLLRENQEELRQRLIRSGLAREYSDSHTEVLANG